MDIKQYMKNRFGSTTVVSTTYGYGSEYGYGYGSEYGGDYYETRGFEREHSREWRPLRTNNNISWNDEEEENGEEVGYFQSVWNVTFHHKYFDVNGNSYTVVDTRDREDGVKEDMVQVKKNTENKRNKQKPTWMTFKEFNKLIVSR